MSLRAESSKQIEKGRSAMQTQDPQEILMGYLLDSSKWGDNTAQPGSISILKTHELAQSIIYIVKYIIEQQQLVYACITIRRTSAGFWELAHFLLMGGAPITDLPQSPPQIAYATYADPQSSMIGVAVMSRETQMTAVRLRDSCGRTFINQLENDAALFVTHYALCKPLFLEIVDHENKLLLQKRLP